APCPSLVGITLAPNAFSPPCTFPGTAPAAGTSTIDIVSATVSEVGNSSNNATALDTAKVITPPAVPVNHFIEIDPFKKVDADNNGTFHPIETAPAAGGQVTYQLGMYSSSSVQV